MSITIAIAQPISHAPPGDEANVADAVAYVERAAEQGADFCVLPESYPGPWRMPATFDPTEQMVDVARRCGLYVQYGSLEPIDDGSRTAHALTVLARPSGDDPWVYRRTHPPGPWIYTGGKYWDFEYVAADDYPVFDTEHGRVGLALCSEVYMPEVTRALALRGAELILMPAGVDKQALWASWRNLIWSRAIENLAIVVTTQNMFSHAQRGLAMVAAPEEILFESTASGLFFVDIDLGRLRELRASEDTVESISHQAAKAGVLSQWQRPELHDTIFMPCPAARRGN